MSLNEIETVYKSLTSCLKCGSSEGFWLYLNRSGGYAQCKHCGSILELCEVFPLGREEKTRKVGKLEILRRKLRL